MLRLLVLLLLLSNMGYFAWSYGTLAPYGFAPAAQSEPQRLAQQVRPEAVRIVIPPEASTGLTSAAVQPGAVVASGPAAAIYSPAPPVFTTSGPDTSAGPAAVATQCLQAGLFSDEQTAALRIRLQNTLPTGSWAFESGIEPARWIIYMGRYSSPDALAKKRGELRQLNVSFEPLNSPVLEPGLSLGNFSAQLDAETELARIARRGVKTAKVIQTQPELRGQRLKLATVSPEMRAQLETVKPQLAGKPLLTCG